METLRGIINQVDSLVREHHQHHTVAVSRGPLAPIVSILNVHVHGLREQYALPKRTALSYDSTFVLLGSNDVLLLAQRIFFHPLFDLEVALVSQ